MPRVSSADNPRLKEAARLLRSSRDRRKAGRCVLEGDHTIAAYCARYGAPETLIVAESASGRDGIRQLVLQVPAARTLVVADSVWAEIAQLPSGLGAIAVIEAPRPQQIALPRLCLLLDDIQDPGNLGSILRTSAAAGFEQVMLSPQCAFAWSPKVLRAGQGAHFHLQIVEDVDLVAWTRAYRGTVFAAVAADGESVFGVDFTPPLAIAIGNEGAGLSSALRSAVGRSVTIPMPGRFESLNAAAAAAVIMFECVRQQEKVADTQATAAS
jgi:RNA methyltransferase, TrmH family